MKTRCSSILKATLALALAFVLLFGTMSTGMAALVKEFSSISAKSYIAATGLNDSNNVKVVYFGMNNTWTPPTLTNRLHVWVSSDTSQNTDYTLEDVPSGLVSDVDSKYYYAIIDSKYDMFGFNGFWGVDWWGDYTYSNNNLGYIYNDNGNKISTDNSIVPLATASLSPSSLSTTVGSAITLSPAITNNSFAYISSVSYSVTKDGADTAAYSITDPTGDANFTPTATGTYVVTATVTINAMGYTGSKNSRTLTAVSTSNIVVSSASYCVPSFTLSGNQSVLVGQTLTNAATHSTGTGTITYSSGNTSIATVDEYGVVTAVSPGTTTITAHCDSTGAIDASYNVTVYAYYLNGLRGSDSGEYWGAGNSTVMFQKDSNGDYYADFTLTSGWDYNQGSNAGFKVYRSSDGAYFGCETTVSENAATGYGTVSLYTGSVNVGITETVTGTYRFKFSLSDIVDNTSYWSISNVKVYYPHTVTFHKNGHGSDGDVPAAQTITYGGTATAPSSVELSATGYIRGSDWYTEAECENVFDFSTTTITENKTLYAQWTPIDYTVNFDVNGGTAGTASASVSANYGVAMPEIASAPTRPGYSFNGYWLDPTTEAEGTKYYNANRSSAKNWDRTETTTLYAHWTKNIGQATASASSNGNVSIDNASAVSSGSLTDLSIDTFKTITAVPDTHYELDHWTVTGTKEANIIVKDSTGATVLHSDSVTGNIAGTNTTLRVYTDGTAGITAGDVTITAHFKDTLYTVTVTAPAGGQISVDNGTNWITSGNSTTTTAGVDTSATIMTRSNDVAASQTEGYNFVSWSGENATFGTAAAQTTTVNVSANTTITCSYTDKTYAVNYHRGSPELSITENADVAEEKLHHSDYTIKGETFHRPGYTQTGWSTSDGGAVVAAYGFGQTYSTNEALDLYPVWTANSLDSDFVVKKDMTIYFDNHDTSHFNDGNSEGNKPKFYFSATGTEASVPVAGVEVREGTVSYNSTDDEHIYFANVPGDSYRFVRIVEQTSGTAGKDSGWFPITSVEKNVIYFQSEKFTGLTTALDSSHAKYTYGFGNIYFDNSNTEWDVSSSSGKALYLVLGNSEDIKWVPMSLVENTNNLYYAGPGTMTEGYTYFAVAYGSTGLDTANTGSSNAEVYGPTGTKGLTSADAYTNLICYYDLSNQNDGSKNKSFMLVGGTPTSGKKNVILDVLWISDSTLTEAGVDNQNIYANRQHTLTVGAGGKVSVSGYKISGANTASAYTSATVKPNGSLNSIYLARTSTATIAVTPVNGYTIDSVTLNSSPLLAGSTVGSTTYYTFEVKGGDDISEIAAKAIAVTFTKTGTSDVLLLGLHTSSSGSSEDALKTWNTDPSANPDRVMNYGNITVGDNNYTDVYYLQMRVRNKYWYSSANSDNNGFEFYDVANDIYYKNNGDGGYKISGVEWPLTNGGNGHTRLASFGDGDDTKNWAVGTYSDYIFIYNPTTLKFWVYFPQEVNYNLYDSTNDTPRLVAYGNPAENYTPTREGYEFVEWCDSSARTSAYDFSTSSITNNSTTLYAKWVSNYATIGVNKLENASASEFTAHGDAALDADKLSGIKEIQIDAPTAAEGYTFVGWVRSGSMANHLRLFTDLSCTTAYTGGTDTTIYVKTDGVSGITSDNAKLTAKYVTTHKLSISDGTDTLTKAEENISGVNGASYTAGAELDFDYGTLVTVAFDDLPARSGIKTVEFATDKSVEFKNYGHYITFNMPDHDVQITNITTETYSCSITVNDSKKVDVIGISSTGNYATGAELDIKITGSDSYAGTSELTGITLKYASGGTVTVNAENLGPLNLIMNEQTLTVQFYVSSDGNYATITGNIGGKLTVTPTCSTSYNLNVTSKIMSDVGSKYVTYYKKESTAPGKMESVHVGELKAYIYYDGINTKIASVTNEDGASELGLGYSGGTVPSKSYKTKTYYLINQDGDGDYINTFPENSEILLVTSDFNSKYSFIGWFNGNASTPEYTSSIANDDTTVVGEQIAVVTLDKSKFIYAVATRDIFIGGWTSSSTGFDGLSWANATQMTYNAAEKVYSYHTQVEVDKDYYFKIFDLAATGCSADSDNDNQAVWYNAAQTRSFNSEYGVTMRNHHNLYTNGTAGFTLTTDQAAVFGSADPSVTIYYKPSTKEVYILPDVMLDRVYLSAGRYDGLSTVGLSDLSVTATLTDNSASATPTTYTTSSTPANNPESIQYYSFSDTNSATVSVAISGTDAGMAVINHFVVYDLENGEADKVAATKSENTYTATITGIKNSTFICPVYELTSDGLTACSVEAYEVNVKSSGNKTTWGGLVAMYVFGSSASDFNAAFPGQLMIPSGDTWTGTIYKKQATEQDHLEGVLFDNYNTTYSFMGSFADLYDYPSWAQTYDYLEPITMMETSDTRLTFILKSNDDGYHGEYYRSENDKSYGPWVLRTTSGNTETVVGKKYSFYDENMKTYLDLDNVYNFEPLLDQDGSDRMNLFGNQIGSAPVGYYVVCVGDADYKNSGTAYYGTYTPHSTYNGQRSVEWYIYDENFVFLGHVLSDALYRKNGGSSNPYIVDYLLATNLTDRDTLMSKSVMITYEAPNTRGDATRFSGQWYTKSTNSKVTVFATVGMITATGEGIVPDPAAVSTAYGSATMAINTSITGILSEDDYDTDGDFDGQYFVNLKQSDLSAGAVTLTAATVGEGNVFKGWYKLDLASGTYTKVVNDLVFHPDVEGSYYAMFEPKVTYNYSYTNRNGILITRSFTGTPLTAAEIANSNTPNISSDGPNFEGLDTNRYAEIMSHLPTVSVFEKTVTFTDSAITASAFTVNVVARNDNVSTEYGLRVFVGYNYQSDSTFGQGLLGVIDNNYNTTVDLTSMEVGTKEAGTSIGSLGSPGTVFYGWKKYNEDDSTTEGPWLSTMPNFGFSLTESQSIIAVFGTYAEKAAALGETWGAYVDKNAVSYEKDGTTSRIYNDSIIRFTYSGDSTRQVSADGFKSTGVILLAQTGAAKEDSTFDSNFSELANANTLKAYVRALDTKEVTVANLKKANYGLSYAFKLETGANISRLNRADICQILNYDDFIGGQYILAAYYKDKDGNIFISNSYVFAQYNTDGRKGISSFPVTDP